jgi:uncharacterized protein YggE
MLISHFAIADGITTSGECTTSFQADRMKVVIEIKSSDKEAAMAFKKVTEDYKKLSETIRKLNLKDFELKTTQARLHEDYEWSGNKRINKGFLGQAGLSVTTSEFQRLGEIMSAFKPQSSNVDSQSFHTFTSSAKSKEVYESCLEKAVENAKSKAEKLARAASVKLGSASSVTEGSDFSSLPPFLGKRQAKSMALESTGESAADMAAEVGLDEMTVKVQVTFEIKK